MNDPAQTAPSTNDTTPSGGDTQAAPATAPSESSQTNAADAGAGSETQKPPHESAPADKSQPPSLTNSKPVASDAQSQSPESVDPEAFKRLRDEKSQWGRQMADARRQNEDFRGQLAKFQQEREQQTQLAAKQKLALHDFRHPEHQAKFQPLLAKADLVRQQVARIRSSKAPEGFTPEQSALWKQSQEDAALSALTDDEHAALSQFNEHSQSFDRQWKLNPAKTLTEYVLPMIRQEMQRSVQEQQAAQSVDQDLADPTLGPVLKEFQPQMAEMIQKLGGTDEAYDFAKHHAMVYAQNKALTEEIARLKQQNGEATLKVGVAQNQQQLAKGKASITRDVTPRNTRTPYEIAAQEADKSGMAKGSPQFFQRLREIEAAQASR